MKKTILLLALALTASASATVSIQGNYGDLFSSSGAAVANNTLYILVASSSAATGFPGGFLANTTLTEGGAGSIFSAGQSLTLGGALGTGTIFQIGGTNGSVADPATSGIALTAGTNLAAGVAYAVYWFPGSTYGGGNQGTVGTQAGGYHSSTGAPTFSVDGMIFPPDGSDVTQGFATVSSGGTTPDIQLRAVNLIPEPSAVLLGAVGALGLLRRRRI